MGTNPVQAWSFFSGLIYTIAQVVFMTDIFSVVLIIYLAYKVKWLATSQTAHLNDQGFSTRDFFPVAMGSIHLKAKEAHLSRLSF